MMLDRLLPVSPPKYVTTVQTGEKVPFGVLLFGLAFAVVGSFSPDAFLLTDSYAPHMFSKFRLSNVGA